MNAASAIVQRPTSASVAVVLVLSAGIWRGGMGPRERPSFRPPPGAVNIVAPSHRAHLSRVSELLRNSRTIWRGICLLRSVALEGEIHCHGAKELAFALADELLGAVNERV